jgi:hypothetical protein
VISAKRPTIEPAVASFAPEWPDENNRQNSSFDDPFSPGLVDPSTSAQWATDHCDSPDAADGTSIFLRNFRP